MEFVCAAAARTPSPKGAGKLTAAPVEGTINLLFQYRQGVLVKWLLRRKKSVFMKRT
ncbi:hypothetical protein HMPREF0080_00733 [Anaeroglobus geminatus F0357]|uniref:Uncharacterized protein n=1 Tax=Anaeroglobus geminatus F0357 TaxID=861450 RepID=G9YGG9_9FIRM|nr:hypothetical protein HMPREF0080_00733 [Anaeroglobus geminatus F0357]